jgi:hypothetical protein
VLADLAHGMHMMPQMRPTVASMFNASALFTTPLSVVDTRNSDGISMPTTMRPSSVLDGDRVALFKQLVVSHM